jgi:serine/threonine protein kinase
VHKQSNEPVAIKVLEMREIDNEVTQYLLACEKEALGAIASPYVLHAHDILQTHQRCFIVTPLCTGGTLKKHIKTRGTTAGT